MSSGPMPARPALTTPWLDALGAGGFSMVLLLPIILFGAGTHEWFRTNYLFFLLALNMPHFMASYRILYRTRQSIGRHRWATLYVPAALLAYVIFALWTASSTRVFVFSFSLVGSLYLAWHYTGQAWGLTAIFAHMNGTPFAARERSLIRWGMYLLLSWHLVWVLHARHRVTRDEQITELIAGVYTALSWGMWVAAALCIAGFLLAYRRTGQPPSLRMLIPCSAIFFWYLAMGREYTAIFWVQLAHALQYLLVTTRVELNVATRNDPAGRPAGAPQLALYGGGLLLASTLVVSLPHVLGPIFEPALGPAAVDAFSPLLYGFVNIHHYFTDGAIWHLRNPEVRREVFGHLR